MKNLWKSILKNKTKLSNHIYTKMVKSYCVKQRKMTNCIMGSEKYVKTKNGRLMMTCVCEECKIKKKIYQRANW